MLLTSANTIEDRDHDRQSIFLAGSIPVNCLENWRESIRNQLGGQYNYFDPTHSTHDQLSDGEMRAHITWELAAMKAADYILLHFLPAATSPISLVELGLYARSKKLTVICPREFYKWRYVDQLCKYYEIPLFDTIDSALNSFPSSPD